MDIHAGLAVTGLVLEVADRPSKYSLSLGGAIMVAKKEVALDWCLTWNRIKLVTDAKTSTEARLVNCDMDELIGIAMATKIPIVIPEQLYSTVSFNGILEKEEGDSNVF